jgi:DNA-binding winged helix-turn-helix (wHTH) protein
MIMRVSPPFRLDALKQHLRRSTEDGAEARIALKPQTYSTPACFLDHPGRPATQEELLESVWRDRYVQPGVGKRHTFDLREAVGVASKILSFPETLPRRFYRFMAPIHEVERSSRTSPRVRLARL